MKRYLSLALMLLIFTCQAWGETKKKAVPQKATTELSRYIIAMQNDPRLRSASWSIRVVDMANGNEVVSYNDHTSLIPASNMKAVTTGAALLMLGGDYRFETGIAYDGQVGHDSVLTGNIYIIGGGDPSLGSVVFPGTVPDSVFRAMARAIKAAGIKRITGSVIADVCNVFDEECRNDSWNWGDIGLGYGAGTNSLQFADNLCKMSFTPGISIGDEASLSSVVPFLPGCVTENHTITVARDSAFNVTVQSSPYSSRIVLKGTVPLGRKGASVNAAIPDPAYHCAWYFSSYLNLYGIATSGNVGVCRTKTDMLPRTVVTTIYSPSLTDLAVETNKNSNNCYAESLLKIIGYKMAGAGSTNMGSMAVMKRLKEAGMALDGFHQVDGSGLSRKNLITTSFMCDYLQMMHRSPQGAAFEQTLSIAGVDGTLRNRLRGSAGERRIIAKSGSMEFVRGYSGYVTTVGGQKLCFSVIINNYSCPSSYIAKCMDNLMNLMAEID